MYAGIDTHKDTLAVAVIDPVGQPITCREEPNSRAGFLRIAGLLDTHHVARVGIEGSGLYGRGIAAHLALDRDHPDVTVHEVPTTMTARERGTRPSKGKTDPTDALAIARITLREPDLPPVRLMVGRAADLRALLNYRDDLTAERSDLVNRLHLDLHGLHPCYQHQIPDLVRKAHLAATQQLLTNHTEVRAEVARRRLARILAIDTEAAQLKHQIAAMVTETGTTLPSIYGIGPLIAARFIADNVDISRYPTRDTFAAANGTAPLAASSGRTQRHRYNPGGNRKLNKCLYTIAITQIRADTPGRACYQR